MKLLAIFLRTNHGLLLISILSISFGIIHVAHGKIFLDLNIVYAIHLTYLYGILET